MYYENYKKLRDEKGLRDSVIAKNTGIDQSTFSHWSKGLYTPKKDKLSKIANFLEVPLDNLCAEKCEVRKSFFQRLFGR